MASLVSQVQNIIHGLCASLPDAVRVMTHGDETGPCVRASSIDLSGDSTSATGAVEKSRVIVSFDDFKTLDDADVVEVGCDRFVVTSRKTDPVSASMTVGLSDRLEETSAVLTGMRRARQLAFPIDVLAECNGRATDYVDGYAPVSVETWTIVVTREEWPEATPPSVGDVIRFDRHGDRALAVSQVVERPNHYILSARSR